MIHRSSHLCIQPPLEACMGHPYIPALNTSFSRANSNSGHAYRCKRLQIVNQMSQIGPRTTSPRPFMQWPFPYVSIPLLCLCFCSQTLPHVSCQSETFSLTCIYCTLTVCRTLHAARIAQSTFQCWLLWVSTLFYCCTVYLLSLFFDLFVATAYFAEPESAPDCSHLFCLMTCRVHPLQPPSRSLWISTKTANGFETSAEWKLINHNLNLLQVYENERYMLMVHHIRETCSHEFWTLVKTVFIP